MIFKIKEFGIEFSFSMSNKKNWEKLKFYRGFYGWKSSSNFGKYLYIKDGILSNFPYIKSNLSTIIVSSKNAKLLRTFFQKENVLFKERLVFLDKKEANLLQLTPSEDWDKIYNEILHKDNFVFEKG